LPTGVGGHRSSTEEVRVRRHRSVAEQVVVVVGATGAVGRAIVLAALDRGARVVAAGPDARALAALAAEADAPHRFETVRIGGPADGDIARAARLARVTTTRFGLLHTWVHIVGAPDVAPRSVDAVADTVLGQLRRSGGGTFVVVAPECGTAAGATARVPVDVDLDLTRLEAARRGRHDLVSVALVRRRGIVPPDRVAHSVLRAAVRPRPVSVVRGSARRDALVARVAPAQWREHRPQGVWLLR
jgi:NAD(P)-dependent dehydrogenase (short-subunit alcohol dehydrogenase family)